MNDNEVLFNSLKLGAIETPHRIFMAPLTRGRSTERVPNALMAEYYTQRASAVPVNRQTIAKVYNRTLKRLGFTHVHGTHFLRATAATLANEATGDFYAVSKLLDHSNPNITLRYVAPTNSAKQKVADALNSVLAFKPPQPLSLAGAG